MTDWLVAVTPAGELHLVPLDVFFVFASGRGKGVAPFGPSGIDETACVESIADLATESCFQASSTPTSGKLFPYSGISNTFTGPAFVGGGEDNQASGSWSTVGGGQDNIASGNYATVTGGCYNAASGKYSAVGGGKNNLASAKYATVGGGGGPVATRNTATGDWSTVAGGHANDATGSQSTVGGGNNNVASGDWSVVAGGENNTAGPYWRSTVCGGSNNDATAKFATVGGGALNNATGEVSTVAGGWNNDATGESATIGGGGSFYSPNVASGDASTIPGGRGNTAQGDYSFAAGRRAKANHDGTFVWGDSFDGDKPSSVANEFNVYASGGVRMFTNSAATTGVLLAPGGSTWTMVSDRDAKENVEPVDERVVLEQVADLPIATWNYKSQDDSIRHMGPMAQDFYAAFGLGLGEKTIDTIDPNGVALAAIQGLYAELEQRLAEKDVEIEELRAANEGLLARVDRLESLAHAAGARGRR